MTKQIENLREKIIKAVSEKCGPALNEYREALSIFKHLETKREVLMDEINNLKNDFAKSFDFATIAEAESAIEARNGIQQKIGQKEKLLEQFDVNFIPAAKQKVDAAAFGITGNLLGITHALQNEEQEKINTLLDAAVEIMTNFHQDCSEAAHILLENRDREYLSLNTKTEWRMFNISRLPYTQNLSGFCIVRY